MKLSNSLIDLGNFSTTGAGAGAEAIGRAAADSVEVGPSIDFCSVLPVAALVSFSFIADSWKIVTSSKRDVAASSLVELNDAIEEI